MRCVTSSSRTRKTISQWLKILPAIPNLTPSDRHRFSNLLLQARETNCFDPGQPVAVVRCPGRFSDYGSHTDYKACGGPVCGTATEEAIYGLFQARADGQVVLQNTNEIFEEKRFPLADTRTGAALCGDWNAWDRWTAERHQDLEGDSSVYGEFAWEKYIKGLLFLLTEIPCISDEGEAGVFSGFSAMFSSDLSYRGGMSSSSALVINTALGLDALYGFSKTDLDAWIDMIGLSEWYVMTRGGCADHARIFYSKRDHFVLVGSFPTSFLGEAPISPDLVRVIVHSGEDRPQDDRTRNEMRIGGAGYTLAMLYIKQNFPGLREELEAKDSFYRVGNLRELTSLGTLEQGITLRFLYDQILRTLPALVDRTRIERDLPDFREELEALFANHDPPEEGYPIRDIAVFGLAEIERAVSFVEACRQEDFDELFRLARLSQDGDRVTKSVLTNGSWKTEPFRFHLSDRMLDHRVQILERDPDSKEVQIQYLPGRFDRSTPAMDRLADVVERHLPHAAAIRVMGAGKGGNMHAIVRGESLDEFMSVIREKYFREIAGIHEPKTLVIRGSSEGARVLDAE